MAWLQGMRERRRRSEDLVIVNIYGVYGPPLNKLELN